MKLLGYKRADFVTKDGNTITGYNVYLAREIDTRVGVGEACERVYLFDAKLKREGIELSALMGHNIRVYYNRYGKVDSIACDD